MSDDESRLLALAEAVADAANVDWAAEESGAKAEESSVIRQLRALANLVAVHRSDLSVLQADTGEVGPTWGPLEIRREIGRGSFATVYLAWDPGLEREVALKLLHAPPGSDQSTAIVREGRLLARVNHPNVVRVFKIDQHDQSVGLTLEYIDGVTLKKVLADRGAFSAHEAALAGIDLCGAVAAVHRAGLLHRDIKAQNVMRAVGGRIVLMDFGGGGVLDDRASYAASMTGTPLYLAPEVLAGDAASIAGDVYSLGVLLYHLVSLKFPVAGSTLDEIREAHTRGDFAPLVDVRPDLPDGFIEVIGRALERDPARRYRSVGAMQQALIRSLGLDRGLAEAAARLPVTPERRSGFPSVAVLPFSNLGPDSDIEYFCDGLADELLTALGKVQGLRVVSRTASFRFKGHSQDIRTISRELDAGAILEGTVSKVGEKLRVTARLINGGNGFVHWSESYKRTMDDVFAVQDEIARSVVERFKLSAAELSPRGGQRRQTDNPRAHHAYLKGRFHWSRRYQGGLAAALECFQRAIAEDAGYVLAHAGLADVYSFLGLYSIQKPKVAFALAATEAERALSIDANVAEVHTSLALIALGRDWNLPEAAQRFARAVEIDATQALPRIYHAWVLVLLNDVPAAIAMARAAQDIDPMSPLVNSGTAYTLFLARQYELAVLELQKALEVEPDFIIALYVKAMCRTQQGQMDEAIGLLEHASALSDRAPFYIGLLGHVYARAGRTDDAARILEELKERALGSYVPPHAFAYVYAGLNDLDRAFECQRRARDEGAAPFNYVSPVIGNMQNDPRHMADMEAMGWMAWGVQAGSGF